MLFRRFDDGPVAEDELVKVMSLTLGWTKPSRAVNLLERGVNAALLDEEDGTYEAAFDPSEVDIPFGFDPSDELFEPPSGSTASETEAPAAETETEPAAEAGDQAEAAPEQTEPDGPPAAGAGAADGILDELLEAIAEKVEGGRKRAVATVNAKQEEMGGLVTLDAAALLVAKERGIDVREHAEAVLERLRDEAR